MVMDKSMAEETEGKALTPITVMAQIESGRRMNEDRSGTMSILLRTFQALLRMNHGIVEDTLRVCNP
jgi:hypothetical protein